MSRRKHKKKKEKSVKEHIFDNITFNKTSNLKFQDIFRLKIREKG